MKIGDLVSERHAKTDCPTYRFGVIVQVQRSRGEIPDYRSQDSFLVFWPGGFEWTWKSEIRVINEGESIL